MKLRNILIYALILIMVLSLAGCRNEKKQSILVKYNAENVKLLRAVTFDPEKDADYPTMKKINDLESIKMFMEEFNDHPTTKTAPNPITKFDVTYYITMNDGSYHTYILTNDDENGYRIIYNNKSYKISHSSYKKLRALYDSFNAPEATTELENYFK